MTATETTTFISLRELGTCLFFTSGAVDDYGKVKSSDTSAYKVLFNLMLERGIYLPPSPYETIFVSSAHTRRDIEGTIQAAAAGFERLVKLRSVEARIESSVH
jgi:glutamate-1-semialdehyde 2,1-aminomutase